MHNALSFQRVHQPKGHTVATYHPETNMAYTYNPKGPHFAKMGNVLSAQNDPLGNDELRGKRLWLLPEEVLYLLERGSLDVRWSTEDDEEDGMGLPMSLQGAYAMFIGDEETHEGALTLERYSVYAGLKRMGYTVMRAPTWDAPDLPLGKDRFAGYRSPPRYTWRVGLRSYYTSWWNLWSPLAAQDEPIDYDQGPLVHSGLYRNYTEIYRRLALISFHDPTSQFSPSYLDPSYLDPDDDQAFRITYHVWKPGSPTFKKSAPGPADFRIAVVNARETAVPTLEELSGLLEMTPYDPPSETAQLYQKLKHGYKNVVLAIVDQGVVSYLRIADAAFGREKLYERKGKPAGGKRGGRRAQGNGIRDRRN